MTRLDLLKILVGQARTNGFEFRRWYTTRLGVPWISADAAFALLDAQRRYYALLFSHEFASTFWKAGADITFQVPAQTFERVTPDGGTATVTRKSFTRRSGRATPGVTTYAKWRSPKNRSATCANTWPSRKTSTKTLRSK
jgi:hypothetical protein